MYVDSFPLGLSANEYSNRPWRTTASSLISSSTSLADCHDQCWRQTSAALLAWQLRSGRSCSLEAHSVAKLVGWSAASSCSCSDVWIVVHPVLSYSDIPNLFLVLVFHDLIWLTLLSFWDRFALETSLAQWFLCFATLSRTDASAQEQDLESSLRLSIFYLYFWVWNHKCLEYQCLSSWYSSL